MNISSDDKIINQPQQRTACAAHHDYEKRAGMLAI